MYRPMFKPPQQNGVVMWLANALLPVIAHAQANIRDVRVLDEDFARLEALRHQRGILTPNHPTGNDPFVPFWLSRKLGQPFNYLAAREVLDGPKGWLMNQVGSYSIIRGTADRESLRMTRRLLAEMDRKVVIFPEGEIYEHNDTLLAFQSGVAQMGFWALDDLVKLKKEPVLPILPIAIKYRCCDAARAAIDNSLRELEAALDLPPAPKSTDYQRLLRVAHVMLAAVEKDIGSTPGEGAELRERLQAYRQRLLERIANAIEARLDPRDSPADQLHGLYHDLRQWVGQLPEDYSPYQARLYRRRVERAAPLYRDLERLQNFIAVTGDYVKTEPTAERFLDVLGRLEREAFGRVRHSVPREALVRIAPPIRLEERYDAYRQNKRQVVADVTRELETTIRGMLVELGRAGTPIALDV